MSLGLFRISTTLHILIVTTEAAMLLPNIFKSGMVLQSKPYKAHIYGYTNSDQEIKLYWNCKSGRVGFIPGTIIDGSFNIMLIPMFEGDICSLNITQGDKRTVDQILLDNVLFGDVFVCSGQSNMQFPMNNIFNATEEIKKSAAYDNIRFYKIDSNTASTPQENLLKDSWAEWSNPTEAGKLGHFSAVCFLTARYINEVYGKKPFGLIGSYWTGTRIEAWSAPESLEQCGADTDVYPNDRHNSASYLYNGMIHPLTRMTVRAFLWYQGEANTSNGTDTYACLFKTLIKSWRQIWHDRTSGINNLDAPFGFVQIADKDPADQGYSLPVLRGEQMRILPSELNDDLKNVFMAMALDTHDEERGLHPRDKQTVAYRMAVASLNKVYGLENYPWEGPRPIKNSTKIIGNGNGTKNVRITFMDGSFTYKPMENSGLYACAMSSDEECNNNRGSWTLIPTSRVIQESPDSLTVTVTSDTVAIAYLWRDSPVQVPHGAPIYTDDSYGLPAPPFKISV